MLFRLRALDRGLAIFLMLLSVLIYAHTYSFDYPRGGGPMVDIAFFPRFLAVALFILSLILLLRGRAGKEEMVSAAKGRTLLPIYISFFFYIFLLNKLGFIVDTFLWLSLMGWLVGERKGWVILLTASLGTGIGYYLFWVVLEVPLPEGRLLPLLGIM